MPKVAQETHVQLHQHVSFVFHIQSTVIAKKCYTGESMKRAGMAPWLRHFTSLKYSMCNLFASIKAVKLTII